MICKRGDCTMMKARMDSIVLRMRSTLLTTVLACIIGHADFLQAMDDQKGIEQAQQLKSAIELCNKGSVRRLLKEDSKSTLQKLKGEYNPLGIALRALAQADLYGNCLAIAALNQIINSLSAHGITCKVENGGRIDDNYLYHVIQEADQRQYEPQDEHAVLAYTHTMCRYIIGYGAAIDYKDAQGKGLWDGWQSPLVKQLHARLRAKTQEIIASSHRVLEM